MIAVVASSTWPAATVGPRSLTAWSTSATATRLAVAAKMTSVKRKVALASCSRALRRAS